LAQYAILSLFKAKDAAAKPEKAKNERLEIRLFHIRNPLLFENEQIPQRGKRHPACKKSFP
jgi:hypothetical protein